MTRLEYISKDSIGKPSEVTCLFHNVAPTWKRMLRQAQQQVLVFSPYLTTVTALGETPDDVPLLVYTDFSLELFASGASSLRALKKIRRWENTEVSWLPGLHAKLVVVDDELVTVGSQNMTVRGETNMEATALINDDKSVTGTLEAIETWRDKALPITDAMIAEIEGLLPPVLKAYRAYSRLCNIGQDIIRELVEEEMAAQARALEEQAALEKQRRKEARLLLRERIRRTKELKEKEISLMKQIRDAAAYIILRVNTFFPEDLVTEEIARDFVRASAWWLKHPSGRPARTQRRAPEYVYPSPRLGYCWSYCNGSNKFMVERAIMRCKKCLLYFLNEERWKNQNNTREALFNYMKANVTECIANCDNEPYQGQYHIEGNDIVFGVHSIDAKDFVECFLFRYADARDLIDALKELETARKEIYNDSGITPEKES